jgi:hypothetical protein
VIAFTSTINRVRNCVARAKRCVWNKKLRELQELTIFALINPNCRPQPRTDEAGNIVVLSGEHSWSIKHAGRLLDLPRAENRFLIWIGLARLHPGYLDPAPEPSCFFLATPFCARAALYVLPWRCFLTCSRFRYGCLSSCAIAERLGRKSHPMALVADHKSSRSSLKSGCRTLPAADLPGTRVPPAMTVQPRCRDARGSCRRAGFSGSAA